MNSPDTTDESRVAEAGLLGLRCLDLGECDPLIAQAFCESVAVSVAQGECGPTLLLARPNRPYVSLGFHQSWVEELDETFLRERGVPVVRRVTGGGTTWLDPSQAFYEVVYPETAELRPGPEGFARFLTGPLAMLRGRGLDAALRPPSDLVVDGRKISGNAGGEHEGALVLQGGILGTADIASMTAMFRSPVRGFRGLLETEMRRSLTSVETATGRRVPAEQLQAGLREAFRSLAGFVLCPSRPTARELQRFRNEVEPRHRDPDWLRPAEIRSVPPGMRRRVRVAGDRFVEAWSVRDSSSALLAVVEAGRTVEAYEVSDPEETSGPVPRPIPLDDERLRVVAFRPSPASLGTS